MWRDLYKFTSSAFYWGIKATEFKRHYMVFKNKFFIIK